MNKSVRRKQRVRDLDQVFECQREKGVRRRAYEIISRKSK